VSRLSRSFAIRSYRKDDAPALARLFNSYFAGFFGHSRVTGASWREQYRRQGWTGPSVEADKDCVRLAERAGRLVGYAVTDYKPIWMTGGALIQELCVVEGEGAREIAEALIEDAEERAKDRGKSFVAVQFAEEDGLAASAAAAGGFDVGPNPDQVFMAVVTDLVGFLAEIADELGRRLRESGFGAWCGTVRVSSGGDGRERQSCDLRIAGGAVEVGPAKGAADISVTVAPEALPLLLMGREWPGDLYLRDQLSVDATEGQDALALLHVLFPRVPVCLPRAQWW
jgi:predicted N-acetyltransferase YhbS